MSAVTQVVRKAETTQGDLSASATSDMQQPTLVLSTIPRGMTGEHPDRIKHIAFHAHCVSQVVSLTHPDNHVKVLVHTPDEGIAGYINETLFNLEVVVIPKEKEMDFVWNLHRMQERYPNAQGYGFFNGDICFTPSYLDAIHHFFSSQCNDNQWRFVSGLRYEVETKLNELNLTHPLETALQWFRKPFKLGGVDFFAWNRDLFLQHVLPHTPQFVMPLWCADNYIHRDGNCNALTLNPEHGYSKDAIVLHFNHREERNGMPSSRNSDWDRQESIDTNRPLCENARAEAKLSNSTWKTNQCRGKPFAWSNHCVHNNYNSNNSGSSMTASSTASYFSCQKFSLNLTRRCRIE